MKMTIKISAIFFLLSFVSCSEDPKPVVEDFYKIITGQTKKTWKVTGIKWTGDGKDDINYSLSSCYKDDLYTFYANEERLYEVSNGATKCSDSEPDQLVSDEWAFVNATSILTIIFPLLSDNSLPFFVRKVTSKEMTIEIYIDQDNTYSYIATFQSVSEE